MAKYDPKLLEEELKNKVARDCFASHFMSDFLKDAANRTASEGTGVRRGAPRTVCKTMCSKGNATFLSRPL